MSDQTLQLIATIRARLERTRLRIAGTSLLSGFLLVAGLLGFLWGVAVLIESILWMPPLFRGIALTLIILVTGWVTLTRVIVPALRYFGLLSGLDEISVARRVGRSFPEINDRMVNLIQLVEGAHSSARGDFLEVAVRSLGEKIQPIPFETVASWKQVRRIARMTTASLVALILFAGAAPDMFSGASSRLLSPMAQFDEPAPFSIIVAPGDIEIIKGDSVRVTARIDGLSAPEQVALEFQITGEVRIQNVELDPSATGVYAYDFLGIRQTLNYRVIGSPVSTDWYVISVVDRPLVQRVNISLDYPSYTRIPTQILDTNVGDIAAIRGTEVTVRTILAGAETASGRLVFGSGDHLSLMLSDIGGSVSFPVENDARYWLELISKDGVANTDPIVYEIVAIADEIPSAVFIFPEPQSLLNESITASFTVRISDDYGFSSARLFYRLAESRFGSPDETFSSIPLPLSETYVLDQEIEYVWQIRNQSSLDLVPGDVIEYFVRVWDNDRVLGFKPAATETYTLQFPSLAEQYQALESADEEAEETLDELLEDARRVRDRFEELQEDLRNNPNKDWQNERRLEQLKSQQEDLESSVDKLSDQVEEMTEQMTENDLVSEETLELFQELQEVIDEINSPELLETLRKLEESLKSMDLNEMQQSLGDFQFNEQLYQERLERTLEIFKQVRLQKDLDEAARRAEDLSELEKRLEEATAKLEEDRKEAGNKSPQDQISPSDSTGTPPPSSDIESESSEEERLAREQEQAAQDMQELERKLEEITQDMQDLRRAPSNQMRDLEEDTRDMQIPKQMNENAEQLREQDLGDAQKGQQKMQRQLNTLQSQLSQMQSNMQGQQMEINLAGLRSILEDILTLSESQEDLRTEVSEMTTESPRLRDSAQRQAELSEGLTIVADSLQNIAKDIPQMTRSVQQHVGDALREMGLATGSIAERGVPKATGHQKGSMTHLNEMALILSELLDQMMNAQGSGGGSPSMQQLLEQLQNLGQQQQQLNQQIQQLLNDAQGNRLTSDMMERLRQLGGMQDQIRQELKQLSRERNTGNKVLGDLTRIAEQMLESIEDLSQGRISRATLQRQRQILTRLLEASRSIQERGKDRRRESRVGESFDRESPAELSLSEQKEQLRRDLFRALDSGYAPDFEQLIRRYFDLLQQRPELFRQE